MVPEGRAAVDDLLRAELHQLVDLLEDLPLDGARDAERIARPARLLVAWPRREALLAPVQRLRVLLVLEQRIAEDVVAVVGLVDCAVD
jgi:hypothetical protein